MARILVVDGDAQRLRAISEDLRYSGNNLWIANSVDSGQQAILSGSFDLLITTDHLPDGTGLDVIPVARLADSSLSVILFSDAPPESPEGLFDILPLNTPAARLRAAARQAVERTILVRENLAMRHAVAYRTSDNEFQTSATEILVGRDQLLTASNSDATLLLLGGPGSDAPGLARSVHQLSARHAKPFIHLPGDLLPSILESGANAAHSALLQSARGGTVFFEDLPELAQSIRPAVAQLVDRSELHRFRSSQMFPVEARLIMSLNSAAGLRSAAGWLQQMRVTRLAIPSLRDRLGDMARFCDILSRQVAAQLRIPVRPVPAVTVDALRRYDFPGNLVELRHMIHRAYLVSNAPELRPEDFLVPAPVDYAPNPDDIYSQPDGASSRSFHLLSFLQETEENLIRRTLDASGGAQAEAARRMGISRSLLSYKLQKYGIRPSER